MPIYGQCCTYKIKSFFLFLLRTYFELKMIPDLYIVELLWSPIGERLMPCFCT